jgi:hypothetical protein
MGNQEERSVGEPCAHTLDTDNERKEPPSTGSHLTLTIPDLTRNSTGTGVKIDDS